VIFFHNDQQRKLAGEYKRKLNAARAFAAPIVTQIIPFGVFFKAEDYHRDYYELHSQQPCCATFIRPKMEKLEKVFHDRLKDSSK
jgi:peptide-methionine (S)-S-oxide reductase